MKIKGKVIAMEISSWHELLNLVNVDKDLSKDNVIEKYKMS
ncbi:hypothetical protein wTpre_809 [Wolbachia endosymbiont of Trichogramma pretiosum]|nr:hypothetical protein wTpre_809 [Wolbachia endosymbiont of Trichogramma pretiosum]